VCHTSQRGAHGERYQQKESNRKHNRQREETLPKPAPEIGPYTIDRFRLNLPDEIQSGLQLAEDRCGTDD